LSLLNQNNFFYFVTSTNTFIWVECCSPQRKPLFYSTLTSLNCLKLPAKLELIAIWRNGFFPMNLNPDCMTYRRNLPLPVRPFHTHPLPYFDAPLCCLTSYFLLASHSNPSIPLNQNQESGIPLGLPFHLSKIVGHLLFVRGGSWG
jgi:hypothetical protein